MGKSLNGVVFNLGVTTVTWTATDGSSNIDVCSFDVTVTDDENPEISCVADQPVTTDEDECTYTHIGTAWNATATDNCTVSTIGYVLTGATTGMGTSLNGVVFNLGVTTVTWTATDGSSNIDVCSFDVTVTDDENPVITCVADQPVTTAVGVCTYTHSGTTWNATATDNCTVASITYALSGATSGTGTSLNGVVFNLGVTTVTWTATDGSSNIDVCSFDVTVTDDENPVITCVAYQPVTLAVCVCTYTHSGTTWNATATDNCTVASITYALSGATSGTGTSLNGVVFNLGVRSEERRAGNGSSNIDVCSFDVTVTDDENPVITCVADQPVTTAVGVCTYTHSGTTWNATATDNCTVASITYALSGATSGTGTSLNGVVFNLGVRSEERRAGNGSSNIDVCSFDVTVTDDENPVITCVADQPVTTAVGVCTYTHSGTTWNATATDNCTVASITYALSGATSGTGTSLNGVVFNLGVRSEERRAGNGSSNIDVCSFDVTVTDDENPVITCVADQPVTTAVGVCTYTHSGTTWNATATDNCTVASITYALSGATSGTGTSLNGVVFNLGVRSEERRAGNGSSNIDVCSFDVTVTDDENPVITCVADQPVTTAVGVCTYTHSGTTWNATATDNCTVASITYALSGATSGTGTSLNGVVFNLGVTTVTWTATDGTYTTLFRSFDVTVTDDENPVITCVADQPVTTAVGVCTYTHSGTTWNATATDNCTVASITYA